MLMIATEKVPMIHYVLRLVDRTVTVSSSYESTREFCCEYLGNGETTSLLEITPEDIAHEREKSAREDALEGIPAREHSDAYLETIALQRKIVEEFFNYNILLFHGSVVAVDGRAYLFTAKSGTGKSTHTRLWREMLGEKAVMVNDDKPFLEITAEGVTAWGSPWMGKHGLGANIGVPLKVICILERGEENSIHPISAQEALPMLMQQSQRPGKPQNYPKYLELIDKLAGKVAFYRMACNMDPQAAEIAYRTMAEEKVENQTQT